MRIAAFTVISALFLAGCGGSDDSTPATTADTGTEMTDTGTMMTTDTGTTTMDTGSMGDTPMPLPTGQIDRMGAPASTPRSSRRI